MIYFIDIVIKYN